MKKIGNIPREIDMVRSSWLEVGNRVMKRQKRRRIVKTGGSPEKPAASREKRRLPEKTGGFPGKMEGRRVEKK